MSDLTVIIPFHAETPVEFLEETLASVLECRSDGLQILVVNAGQYSDSYSIQEEGVRFLSADPQSDLVDCVKLGLNEAAAPVVQILLCGVVVTEGWDVRALESFYPGGAAALVPLIEEPSEGETVRLTGWIYRPDGKIDAAAEGPDPAEGILAPTRFSAFFRRDVLADLDWPEAIPMDFAMIDAALLVRALGMKVVRDEAVRLELRDVAEEPVDLFGFWKYSEFLQCRWLPLADGQTLPLYRGGSFWLKVRAFFSGKYPLFHRAQDEGKNLALQCPVKPILERACRTAQSER
ncbi:MAG: hypothetical protein IJH68_01695 [Thermoguttaceae bacterium]|nr:hypothetical protein [Thermoguttaceae bacterium]